MNKMEDYKEAGIIKRITNYEDLRKNEEYWRGEYERIEDNVIRRLIDLDVKLDHRFDELNKKLDELLPKKKCSGKCSKGCEKNRNKANFNEKVKNDKSIEKNKKVENKANKRGRPKKIKD